MVDRNPSAHISGKFRDSIIWLKTVVRSSDNISLQYFIISAGILSHPGDLLFFKVVNCCLCLLYSEIWIEYIHFHCIVAT